MNLGQVASIMRMIEPKVIPHFDPEAMDVLDRLLERRMRHKAIDERAEEIMRDVRQRCKVVNYAFGQRMRRARERGWT